MINSSTRHECLCRITTKELLQWVFLIIYNCLWNELCVAITTVTNRTLKRVHDSTHPCNFPFILGYANVFAYPLDVYCDFLIVCVSDYYNSKNIFL